MYPALVVDLNCGLRDKELRELRWQQIDLVHKKQLTVGKSKTDGRHGAGDPAERHGHDRPGSARRVVHPAVRRVQAGVVRFPRRQGPAERSHPPSHDLKDGVDEGPRQSESRRAVARQSPHAGHGAF